MDPLAAAAELDVCRGALADADAQLDQLKVSGYGAAREAQSERAEAERGALRAEAEAARQRERADAAEASPFMAF